MSMLKLQNSLSGEKEEFVPLDPAHIRLYACGPTVYNYAHIGNARMAVVFDLLANILRKTYPKVTYVSNITDVDDKIIAASLEIGLPIKDITEKYTKIYNEDMAALGVRVPDIQPKATEHIEEMICLTKTLIEKGHAYESDGHVLFDVPSFPAYGRLSGRKREEQIAGARVNVASYKKNPADFVLWKPSSDSEPGWDSPWGENKGRGRPGWHLECSAMAEKHLGLPFDIHGGGADLKFPHHENEIAQSCCAHGSEDEITSFAKYWIHNGFVTVENEKMAKSVGNITLVHDLIQTHSDKTSDKFSGEFSGEVLRMALLSAHYRQPLDWSKKTIEQSKQYLDRIYNILNKAENIETSEENDVPPSVLGALHDDLNTPKAFAAISSLSKELAKSLKDNDLEKARTYKSRLLTAGKMIGILQLKPSMRRGSGKTVNHADADEIEGLVNERQKAKADKNYDRADKIRAKLDEMGIIVEDTPSGPQWHCA